ncbi:MAG: acetyl-CoA carboxylase biotin carboxyl carrier protein [Candidatus Marinamargulisbacteria bacterium]
MDFKKIKKLVSLVETSDISSLSVEEDNLKVEIKREGPAQIIQSSVPAQTIQAAPAAPPAPVASESPAAPATPTADDTAGLIEIKSPMVGTFYSSPNPESPAFVEVGKTIKKGDVVCIIEAMKLFNEIEAEIEGTIEKVCLENSAPVEFGQTLFLVRK